MSADGVTGEHRPEPRAATPRPEGQGLGELTAAPEVDRGDRLELVRAGELASLHSWELVTAVDGPGTRMTVFLSGCPLRCLYCHNPDTMEMRRGELVDTGDIIKRMGRYRRIFDRSGGGLTISGGEPLMQPRVVERLLAAAKKDGIHTAIDTSGNLGMRCSDAMLENLDLCLLDLKSGCEETYTKVTGAKLQPTLDFADRLGRAGVEVWVRFVLVPRLTDQKENIEKVAALAAQIPTCSRVEVLPFHQMGQDKWEQLGLNYELADLQPPSPAQVEQARKIFRKSGLTVY